MGSYELIGNILHYTGDGWVSCELTEEQISQFKKEELDLIKLDWS